MSNFKLGRLRRSHDPRVPHLRMLLDGRTPAAAPAAVHWTSGMPAKLGAMLNDTLGDCTCAAVYHAMQVWSFNAGGTMQTQPDADVEQFYVQACGYNPRAGGEGPGGNEQHVLSIIGGHAVVLAGYDANGARLISWGSYYTMTWRFFAKYVDEVYAIADPDWISSKGTTPGGLSLQALQAQMKALAQG